MEPTNKPQVKLPRARPTSRDNFYTEPLPGKPVKNDPYLPMQWTKTKNREWVRVLICVVLGFAIVIAIILFIAMSKTAPDGRYW